MTTCRVCSAWRGDARRRPRRRQPGDSRRTSSTSSVASGPRRSSACRGRAGCALEGGRLVPEGEAVTPRLRGDPRSPPVVSRAACLLRSRRSGGPDGVPAERSGVDRAPGRQRPRRQGARSRPTPRPPTPSRRGRPSAAGSRTFIALAMDARNVFAANQSAVSLNLNAVALVGLKSAGHLQRAGDLPPARDAQADRRHGDLRRQGARVGDYRLLGLPLGRHAARRLRVGHQGAPHRRPRSPRRAVAPRDAGHARRAHRALRQPHHARPAGRSADGPDAADRPAPAWRWHA